MFSPPNDHDFLKELQKLMKNTKIYIGQEIVKLFKSNLDKIDMDSEVSLLEQEICLLSDFFLYSEHSTWSTNVVLERIISGKKDHSYNLNFQWNETDILSQKLPTCDYNSPLLIGSIKPKMNLIDPVSKETVLESLGSNLAPGGCYKRERRRTSRNSDWFTPTLNNSSRNTFGRLDI